MNDLQSKRMEELVETLNDWAYRYYVLDEPAVSDARYDELYGELLALEQETGTRLPSSPQTGLAARF